MKMLPVKSAPEQEKEFQPFETKIRFESEDEFYRFYCLFNHTDFVENYLKMSLEEARQVRDTLVREFNKSNKK